MPKQRKLQPLTEKQHTFMQELAHGLTPFEAAKKVYDCKNDNVARVIGSKNARHPVIYQTVRELMETKGSKARSKNILKAIEGGLLAERVYVTRTGKPCKTPNHAVRLKAAELALKVKGELSQDIPDMNVRKEIKVTFNLIPARDTAEVKRLTEDAFSGRSPVLEG
jgi:hypothetical protein